MNATTGAFNLHHWLGDRQFSSICWSDGDGFSPLPGFRLIEDGVGIFRLDPNCTDPYDQTCLTLID